MNNTSNNLGDETSPYLRQHANNPVDWYPWGKEALEKAKAENKPILLSIGYSSCHWCHVMAHESFENDSIARLMNENFVNIKLDREERPDIDQIYMDAVQAMGLHGGWPLNVFLTPDQKPFYGGTYFPPDQWVRLLKSVTEAYEKNYDKLSDSADKFAESLQLSEIQKYGLSEKSTSLTGDDFDSAYQQLDRKFDPDWGGIKKAPKFPMPSVWEFLGAYYSYSGNQKAKDHLLFTLDKIAAGGIYDQIGGGFARYSVDGEWHVPHFEKMLYDNGQLMSLYAHGYMISKKPEYKRVLTKTAEWLKREMLDSSGGFYSALDADSEGEEGKFYVWDYAEVKELAGEQFSIIAEYYDISKGGNWEGKNVLRRLESDEKLAKELSLSLEELEKIVEEFNEKALVTREKRMRPGLDDKILSGWNGLMLTGLCEAYQAIGDPLFLELANNNVSFIRESLIKNEQLVRLYKTDLQGFLEDYAAVIKGLITHYETTHVESSLNLAKILTDHAIEAFYDEKEQFFYFTGDHAENLIARKKELFDNVIPSSNSLMAHNLYRLGIMFDHTKYQEISGTMVEKVSHLIVQEPEYLSNWGLSALMMAQPTAEVIITGPGADSLAAEFNRYFLPNKVLMVSSTASKLPLMAHKEPENGKATIFVCYSKTCRRPVHGVSEALSEINDAR